VAWLSNLSKFYKREKNTKKEKTKFLKKKGKKFPKKEIFVFVF